MYIFPIKQKWRAYITESIIIACVIMYMIELFFPPVLDLLALVPQEILSGKKLWTLITHMFLHSPYDPLHIFFNMWFLWIFGQDIEKKLGHTKFLVFYLSSGIFAALFHVWFVITFLPEFSDIPAVGASGALFGLLAAFGLLYPRRKILAFFFPLVVAMDAWKFALIFVGIQVIYMILEIMTQTPYGVAFAAHVGGFIFGVILIYLFKLPERAHAYPYQPPYEFRITVYQYGADYAEMPYEEEEEDYFW